MIRLENVSKKYSTDYVDTYAICNLNLKIAKGEYVAICGPSGSGKSTLLSILGVLERATEGSYYINDVDVFSLSNQALTSFRRDNLGFIFQAFNLIDSLSVLDNVALPLICRNHSSKEAKDIARGVLSDFGMDARVNHFPSQLSGGQQQRVAIARALVAEPKLVLADEPTGNLDSENGEIVMDSLDSLHNKGATICLVTHDESIAQTTQRIIRMHDGKVVN